MTTQSGCGHKGKIDGGNITLKTCGHNPVGVCELCRRKELRELRATIQTLTQERDALREEAGKAQEGVIIMGTEIIQRDAHNAAIEAASDYMKKLGYANNAFRMCNELKR